MALLRDIAEKLSNNQLERGVIEEFIEADALYTFMPWMRVDSKAYVYNREDELAGGTYLAPNGTVTESASSVIEVTAYLKNLIGDVDVDKFLDATMSDTNSQKAIQIALKAKGMSRQFKNELINGTVSGSARTSTTFDGLKALAEGNTTSPVPGDTAGNDRSMVINAAEAALDLGMLDELIHMVDNGADALLMNKTMWRRVRALLRAASGGMVPTTMMIEGFGSVPAYDGVPVILNDFIQGQGTGNGFYNIYALRFNLADGFHGIYNGDNAGFTVEDIGTLETKDATRTRLKFYHSCCLKSTRSLAAITNVN